MIVLVDKNLLFTTFSVCSFCDLEDTLSSMSPSMAEYYLSDLSSEYTQETYFNRSNIQTSIFFGEYSLYLDYSDNIYLEFIKNDSYETESFW